MKRSERIKIAKKWRVRREGSGHTLDSFAQTYRFLGAQLSRWERGIWIPSTTSVERMESAFKLEKV